jgi:hypothetical protein
VALRELRWPRSYRWPRVIQSSLGGLRVASEVADGLRGRRWPRGSQVASGAAGGHGGPHVVTGNLISTTSVVFIGPYTYTTNSDRNSCVEYLLIESLKGRRTGFNGAGLQTEMQRPKPRAKETDRGDEGLQTLICML